VCSFGASCSFENLKFSDTETRYFIRINNIGSRNDGCYVFNAIDGLYVRCGCWFGTAKNFLAAVEDEHKGTKYQKEYQIAIKLAEVSFSKEARCG
jgi:hypothetical protein